MERRKGVLFPREDGGSRDKQFYREPLGCSWSPTPPTGEGLVRANPCCIPSGVSHMGRLGLPVRSL